MSDTKKITSAEAELGRTAELIGDIVTARATGNRNSVQGNSDDDLLAAVEECATSIEVWYGSW